MVKRMGQMMGNIVVYNVRNLDTNFYHSTYRREMIFMNLAFIL